MADGLSLDATLFNGLYFVALVVVAFPTRATARWIATALAAGSVFAVIALGIMALGEAVPWWQMAVTWEPIYVERIMRPANSTRPDSLPPQSL